MLALTANAMKGDEELCMAAGMDGYLTKPIQVDALRRALERIRCGADPGAARGAG